MKYKNPIPMVDGGKKFKLKVIFTFESELSIMDAVEGISNVVIETLNKNDQKIPLEWIDVEWGK